MNANVDQMVSENMLSSEVPVQSKRQTGHGSKYFGGGRFVMARCRIDGLGDRADREIGEMHRRIEEDMTHVVEMPARLK